MAPSHPPAQALPGLCQIPGLALWGTSPLLSPPPPRSPAQAYWRLRGCEGGNATAFLGPWGAGWAGNWGPLWAGACKERASHSVIVRVGGQWLGLRPGRFSHQPLLGQGKGHPTEEGGLGGRGGWMRLRQEQAEGLLSVPGDHPWRMTYAWLTWGLLISHSTPQMQWGGGREKHCGVVGD